MKRQMLMLEVFFDPAREDSEWGPVDPPATWDWETLTGEGPVRVVWHSEVMDAHEHAA